MMLNLQNKTILVLYVIYIEMIILKILLLTIAMKQERSEHYCATTVIVGQGFLKRVQALYKKLLPIQINTSSIKNWTKVYGFLVCKGERRVPPKHLPPPPASRGTPHCFIQLHTNQKLFSKIILPGNSFSIAIEYIVTMLCYVVQYTIVYNRVAQKSLGSPHYIYSIVYYILYIKPAAALDTALNY